MSASTQTLKNYTDFFSQLKHTTKPLLPIGRVANTIVAMVRLSLLFGTLCLCAHALSEQQQQLQQQPYPLAPPTLEFHPVYILDRTCTAQSNSNPLGRALKKIGYSPGRPHDPKITKGPHGLETSLPPRTYTFLCIQRDEYVHLAREDPEVKFITHAVADNAVNSGNDTGALPWREMQHFFSQQPHSHQLLIVDVNAPERANQAENWEKICVFLGLGYSMVERMRLWLLP